MQKIHTILSIRINFGVIFLLLAGCAASGERRATEDIGPVTAYARNTLAAENPAGLVRIGEGFERAGDFIGARKLYAQARAVAPDMIEADIAYARASGKAGFGDEAVAILTLLLERQPMNPLVISTLATVHADAARYSAAMSVLSRLEQPSIAVLTLKGKLAHAVGDAEGGREMLSAALDQAPANPSVLEAMALSFALNGDYASSVALLRRAMDDRSGGAAAQRSLALVYALSGQRQAALRLARDVMPANDVQRLQTFFRFLPRFSAEEQAAAVFFDRVPADTLARLSGAATN